MRGRRRSRRGFALPELLVAATLTLLVAGSVFALLGPSGAAFRTEAERADLQQRMRSAVDALTWRVLSAGSAAATGQQAAALGSQVPCVLPFRLGRRGSDAAGSWRSDLLTLISAASGTKAGFLLEPLSSAAGRAVLDGDRCLPATPACGVTPDTMVLVLAEGGRFGLFRVEAVAGPVLTLARTPAAAGQSFPAGSPVLVVDIQTFYLGSAEGAEGPRLMRYDGWESDLPLLDHVVAFEVSYLGEAEPPLLRTLGGGPALQSTYGPAPPAAGVDLGYGWGPGENCVFERANGLAAPRLSRLGVNPVGLVPLNAEALTDGPWCPGPNAPARFDADLFRVRRVHVRARFEAGSSSARGRDSGLFARPGAGAEAAALVADQEMTLDLVPRALEVGR